MRHAFSAQGCGWDVSSHGPESVRLAWLDWSDSRTGMLNTPVVSGSATATATATAMPRPGARPQVAPIHTLFTNFLNSARGAVAVNFGLYARLSIMCPPSAAAD